MNKIFIFFCIGVLLVTSIFAFSVLLNGKNQQYANNGIVSENKTETSDNAGLVVSSPTPNDFIVSPLKITGMVKGDGWTGFEGQVGTVKLQDSNGKELASTYLAATTEWTQLPTSFEANLIFDKGSATSGRLIFHNENASGDLERDKTFIMPVKFK